MIGEVAPAAPLAGVPLLEDLKFGATPEDRMRLRLTVQTPGEQAKEQPTGPSGGAARRRNLHIAG
jgi:hypothetical protein